MPDIEDATTIDYYPLRDQGSHPGNAAAGTVRLYTVGGHPYLKDESGTLTDLDPVQVVDFADLGDKAHSHQDAAGGGQLNASLALGSGQLPLARGGTGADLSGSSGPGFLVQASAGAVASNKKSNFAATAAPALTDDSASGYGVGSFWFDTTNDLMYVCLDASVGAAVWKDATASGGGGDPTLTFGDIESGGISIASTSFVTVLSFDLPAAYVVDGAVLDFEGVIESINNSGANRIYTYDVEVEGTLLYQQVTFVATPGGGDRGLHKFSGRVIFDPTNNDLDYRFYAESYITNIAASANIRQTKSGDNQAITYSGDINVTVRAKSDNATGNQFGIGVVKARLFPPNPA
jgi:hypothetical protein